MRGAGIWERLAEDSKESFADTWGTLKSDVGVLASLTEQSEDSRARHELHCLLIRTPLHEHLLDFVFIFFLSASLQVANLFL